MSEYDCWWCRLRAAWYDRKWRTLSAFWCIRRQIVETPKTYWRRWVTRNQVHIADSWNLVEYRDGAVGIVCRCCRQVHRAASLRELERTVKVA